MPHDYLLVFPSELGWMAVVLAGEKVRRLTFGHPTSVAARKAVADISCPKEIKKHGLALRLQAYASGNPNSLRDVAVDFGRVGLFRRRVLNQCRLIPYGGTLSYGKLAAGAGFPRAARAVGNCMAANRIPLIIPCHRVVRSDGQVGPYSAGGGTAMKRRLLSLESR